MARWRVCDEETMQANCGSAVYRQRVYEFAPGGVVEVAPEDLEALPRWLLVGKEPEVPPPAPKPPARKRTTKHEAASRPKRGARKGKA